MNGTYKTIYFVIGAIAVVVVVVAVAAYFYMTLRAQPPAAEQLTDSYNQIGGGFTLQENSPQLQTALERFRDIAADESKSNLERVMALNGINYSYTQSDFDSDALYEAVFSKPPFSQYYVAPNAASADPLHPESGGKVAAIEAALVKLNQLSNSLVPNHYAITRMEVANVFAYQRGVVTAKDPKALRREIADNIKSLSEGYDALKPLETYASSYPLPMRLQMMFAHASALEFVAATYADKGYRDRAEKLFQDTITLGDSYPKDGPDYVKIQNQTLLARIFYVSHFWKTYKLSNPDKMKDVIRPLVDADPRSAIYRDYLPTHATANVGPFTVLRDVAKQMPELKAFLEKMGWKF